MGDCSDEFTLAIADFLDEASINCSEMTGDWIDNFGIEFTLEQEVVGADQVITGSFGDDACGPYNIVSGILGPDLEFVATGENTNPSFLCCDEVTYSTSDRCNTAEGIATNICTFPFAVTMTRTSGPPPILGSDPSRATPLSRFAGD